MPQKLTLTLPDNLYHPIYRLAETTHEPVEDVLLTALRASLPPLDGLPADLIKELTELEFRDSGSLRRTLLEKVRPDHQERLELLLDKNQQGILTEEEQYELSLLQKSADRIMFRKARAAVLLRFRGERLPTLTELRHLTGDE